MPATVMLAYLHGVNTRAAFTESLLRVSQECADLARICPVYSPPGLGPARNETARQFLASGLPWLWMVDTDMVFTPATLPALLDQAGPGAPVVGALCMAQPAAGGLDAVPTMYEAVQHEGGLAFRSLRRWPEGTLLRVGATGCGCLLVHRDVFARLSAACPDDDGLWFSPVITAGHEFSEDLSFCLRLAQAGMPVHVHTGIKVGHVKEVILGEVFP